MWAGDSLAAGSVGVSPRPPRAGPGSQALSCHPTGIRAEGQTQPFPGDEDTPKLRTGWAEPGCGELEPSPAAAFFGQVLMALGQTWTPGPGQNWSTPEGGQGMGLPFTLLYLFENTANGNQKWFYMYLPRIVLLLKFDRNLRRVKDWNVKLELLLVSLELFLQSPCFLFT